MRSAIRKALGFLLFVMVLAVLQSAHSKALDLLFVCLVLAFCVVGSGVVVIKTLTKEAGSPNSRAGWGNSLSVLPESWQRWLLDEKGK